MNHRVLLANYQRIDALVAFQLMDGRMLVGAVGPMVFDAENPQNDEITVVTADSAETVRMGEIFRLWTHVFTNLSPFAAVL